MSQTPGSTAGKPWTIFLSSPVSWSWRISSAPPTYLPPMKTLGNVNFLWPRICCNSLRNPESMDRSRSSIETRNPRRIDRTALQSSNVRRTTRRLVKYNTIRFSAPGNEIDGPDWPLKTDSGGRAVQERRSELASRTRWKMEGKGFLEVENWEVEEEESDSSSSKQRSGRSLKEEQAKWVDGDNDVSWILTLDGIVDIKFFF